MEELDRPEIDSSQDRAQEIFHENLRLNQVQIRDVYDEGEFTKEFADGVIDKLNRLCPYIKKTVALSGVAMVPVFSDDGDEVIDQVWQNAISYGLHRGVIMIMDESGPVLAHQVQTGQHQGVKEPTVRGSFDIYNCFIVNSNVTIISDIEDSFSPFYLSQHFNYEDPQMGVGVLKFMSDEFAKMINDTGFRRLTKSKQDSLINEIIEDTVKYSSLVEQEMVIEAQYGYTTYVDPIRFEPELKPISIGQRLIIGSCLTIDMLETTDRRKDRITSDKTLVDKKAGLCLVLDLDDESREVLSLEESQALYIPVSSQNINIELA